MEEFFKKLNKVKSGLRLSDRKKDEIRGSILRAMAEGEMAPVASPAGFWRRFLRPVPALAAFLILAVSGTAFAAEKSLPGESLYWVKINVNEKVAGTLAVSAEAKSDWQVAKVERRLDEAAELVTKGKLTDETQAEVESGLENSANAVQIDVDELNSSGNVTAAANLASRLESAVASRVEVLSAVSRNVFAQRPAPKAALSLIQTKNISSGMVLRAQKVLQKTVESRIKLENKVAETVSSSVEVKSAAEAQIRAAVKTIKESRNYLKKNMKELGPNATAAVEAEIKAAEATTKDASAKAEAGLYGDSFNLSNGAIRAAEKTQVIVGARANLNVDVDESAEIPDVEKSATSGAAFSAPARTNVSSSDDNTKTDTGETQKIEIGD